MDDGATEQERYLGKEEFDNGMDGDYFSVWIGWVKGIFETLTEMTRGWVFGCVWNAKTLGMEMCVLSKQE